MLGEVAKGLAQRHRRRPQTRRSPESLALIDTPIANHNITDLGDLMRLSDRLLPILLEPYESEGAMMAAFTRPSKSLRSVGVGLPARQADARYLAALLKRRCAAP